LLPCKCFYHILYNFLFSKLSILIYKLPNSLKVGLLLFLPHTPQWLSTKFFSKMILKMKCQQSIIQFQWKCLHNIVYSEHRLQKMVNSNGQCHFCKHEIESHLHLFYRCHQIKHVLGELKHIFKIIFEKNLVLNHWGVWGRNNSKL
jgi:hypothetical protein